MSQSATEKPAQVSLPPIAPPPLPVNSSSHGFLADHKVWLIMIGLLGAITAGHYSISGEYHMAHNILQRLYYVPIILAAIHRGRRGGLVVSTISGALYLPHILLGWQANPEYQINQLMEIILFLIVGLAAGHLSEQKALRLQQLHSSQKMALFGKRSRTIIRALKGPLNAVQGILVALEPLERGHVALESFTQIIRTEVTKIETLRNELISLVERRRIRLKQQNLNDLLLEFASQVKMGLAFEGIRVRKRVQDVELPVQCNRKAIQKVLHRLTGCILDRRQQIRELTFYSGQSTTCTWLGVTADQILLPTCQRSAMTSLDAYDFHGHELTSIINVMHNHFGDVKFRWQGSRMVEFTLVFQRKLRLPWYLRDAPRTDNRQHRVLRGKKEDHG